MTTTRTTTRAIGTGRGSNKKGTMLVLVECANQFNEVVAVCHAEPEATVRTRKLAKEENHIVGKFFEQIWQIA
jgi:hypothetical protein